MKKIRFKVQFRRKREGKTNYKKRLKLLLSQKPRLVIRVSLKNTIAQIIQYVANGDKILVSASSSDLKKIGWKFGTGNIPAAYLTGLLLGSKAKKQGITEAVVDTGLKKPTKGARVFACLNGIVDAGLNVPHSKEVFPSKDRISGKDIAKYAESLKADKERYEKQFSSLLKNKLNPSDITKAFEDIKSKVKL